MEPGRKDVSFVTKKVRLDDKFEFDAVSYVWGTAPTSVSVPCNGSSLLVTPVAYEMAKYLGEYNRWLWIDAICINQQDSAEKEVQIPLMREIYAKADDVFIWMGPSTPETEHFMYNFPKALQYASSWDYEVELQQNPAYNKLYWPWDDEMFFAGLYQVLNQEWFRRLWTFQEVVLGRRSLIVSGHHCINGSAFFYFIKHGRRGTSGYIFLRAESASCMNYDYERYYHAVTACDRISYSHQVLHLRKATVINENSVASILFDLHNMQVKEPIDRVWAIAALLGQDVQEMLTPRVDYSSEGRLAYQKTYLNFCTAVIRARRSLILLRYPRPRQRENNWRPSWCPDFSAQPVCSFRIWGSWNDPVPPKSSNTSRLLIRADDDDSASLARRAAIVEHSQRFNSISDQDHILSVRGFVVGTVVEVVEDLTLSGRPSYPVPWLLEDLNDLDPYYVATLQLLDRLISLTGFPAPVSTPPVSQIPMDLFMVLLRDCRIGTHAEEAFQDAMACLRGGGHILYNSLEPGRRSRAWGMMQVMIAVSDHAFFTTSSGHLGIGIPGLISGAKVCAFYGEEELYILRGPYRDSLGSEPEVEHFEFCGVAFVPHLMEQHERDSAKQGDDVVFKIR